MRPLSIAETRDEYALDVADLDTYEPRESLLLRIRVYESGGGTAVYDSTHLINWDTETLTIPKDGLPESDDGFEFQFDVAIARDPTRVQRVVHAIKTAPKTVILLWTVVLLIAGYTLVLPAIGTLLP